MEHAICINKNSFPAADIASAQELFHDAIQGVLALYEEECRFTFYLDSNKEPLFDLELAENFRIQDFINGLDDTDLQLFLYECEDKSPALDFLSNDQIEEMLEYKFYIHSRAISSDDDSYALSWAVSGILLSLNTDDLWRLPFINVSRLDKDGQYLEDGVFNLRNISSVAHGKAHYAELTQPAKIQDIVGENISSSELEEWYLEQSKENQTRIIDKIKLAYDKGFSGGEPLFKPLQNGIKEIRFSAYAGGAIRILFQSIPENKYILLCGFIKKSDDEGYDYALDLAKKIYQAYPNH